MMPETELFIECWNQLCNEAIAGGFDSDRAHRFADANADALYQNRLRDRLDETVMLADGR